MTTEPKLYTRNWIDDRTIFTVSHGADSIENIFDRDLLTQWASVDADDDSTPIEIIAEFSSARNVDTVMIANHNLQDVSVQYWNGSAFAAWASASGITADFTKLTGTLRNTTKIRIIANATRTPDQEKAIGELMACALALDFARDLKSYEPTSRERVATNTLGDGSVRQVRTMFTPYRSQKYEARASVQFLLREKRRTYRQLRDAGDPLLWQPESISNPEEVYLVLLTGPDRWSFSDGFKGAGLSVPFEVREV